MVAPNIAQDDRTTNVQGFCALQNEQQEKEDTIDAMCIMTTPEIQVIHCVCCMQKQVKGRTCIFRTIADVYRH